MLVNRKQRRSFQQNYKNSAWGRATDIRNKIFQEIDNPLREGDLVKIDVDRITKRKDYSEKTDEYRAFVESSRDRVFTANLYRKGNDGFSAIIELAEEPTWLFWCGDLVRVENGG